MPRRSATDAVCRNPVGTYLTIGKGLHCGAFDEAARIGAEAIQVFAGNPRAWARSGGDPRQDSAFRDACGAHDIRAFLHSPYLVNLGSPVPETFQRSVSVVAHSLHRAVEIGAEGVVVHTGSSVADGSFAAAMRQVREGLLPLLDALLDDSAPWLLLEPTAGQGQSLCAGVDMLGDYLTALDFHPKAGICLDTCHVFAAGAPLDEPGGTTATVDELVAVGGVGRLRLIHANDSMEFVSRSVGELRPEPYGAGPGPVAASAQRRRVRGSGCGGVRSVCSTR